MKVAHAAAAPRKAKKKAAFQAESRVELKTDSAQSLSPITALNGGVPHEPKLVGVVDGEKPAIEGSILKSDFADTKAVSKNNKKAKRKAASRQQREGVVQSKLPYSIALSEGFHLCKSLLLTLRSARHQVEGPNLNMFMWRVEKFYLCGILLLGGLSLFETS